MARQLRIGASRRARNALIRFAHQFLEVREPVALGFGVRHLQAACPPDRGKGVGRVHARQDKGRTGHQRGAPDAGPAMDRDRLALFAMPADRVRDRSRRQHVGDGAIGDRKGAELDPMSATSVRLTGQLQVANLLRLQKRQNNVQAVRFPGSDLAVEPLARPRPGHDAEPARLRMLYPADARTHRRLPERDQRHQRPRMFSLSSPRSSRRSCSRARRAAARPTSAPARDIRGCRISGRAPARRGRAAR